MYRQARHPSHRSPHSLPARRVLLPSPRRIYRSLHGVTTSRCGWRIRAEALSRELPPQDARSGGCWPPHRQDCCVFGHQRPDPQGLAQPGTDGKRSVTRLQPRRADSIGCGRHSHTWAQAPGGGAEARIVSCLQSARPRRVELLMARAGITVLPGSLRPRTRREPPTATHPHYPGDRPNRHPLRPVQPANLSPILH